MKALLPAYWKRGSNPAPFDGDSVSTLFTFKIYQPTSEIGTLSLERQDNGAFKKIWFFRRIAFRVKEEELPEALVYLGFVEGDDDEFAIGGVTL